MHFILHIPYTFHITYYYLVSFLCEITVELTTEWRAVKDTLKMTGHFLQRASVFMANLQEVTCKIREFKRVFDCTPLCSFGFLVIY